MTQRLLSGLLVLAAALCAQPPVDPRNTYKRIICVVPLVGKGTSDDPRRPKHTEPLFSDVSGTKGIIAFSQIATDDGRYAVVEFVARDRAAFEAILNDSDVKIFEKGKDKKDAIERELKKYRKDFDLTKFGMVLP